MGQETLYLLLTSAIFATIILLTYVHPPPPLPRPEPPIITLKESDGFYFQPDSSDISSHFAAQLRDTIAPKLRELGERYNAKTIEIIGHTDEVPIGSSGHRLDNLDKTLIPLLNGNPIAEPVAGDNAGLGMARAVSVARALKADGIGASFTIIPMSAGAFLRPDDHVTEGLQSIPDESRRRIEIRLRRPQPH
jgi:outer membrane protein OmpA-like peptidoglycan-associated protein